MGRRVWRRSNSLFPPNATESSSTPQASITEQLSQLSITTQAAEALSRTAQASISGPFSNTEQVATYTSIATYSNRSQCNWRLCQKCHSLQHASALCPATGVHDFSESENYTLAHGSHTYPRGEGGWNWCNKCQIISFTGLTHGPCSARHVHDTSGSGAYYIPFEPENFNGLASSRSWRRCEKCQGLAFAGGLGAGACEAGGEHRYVQNAAGAPYVLSTNHFPYVHGETQDHWRHCRKCNLLAFDGYSFCVAGGTHHSAQSENFFLEIEPPTVSDGVIGIKAFRTCTKCNCLIYAQDPSATQQTPGPCGNGGFHNPDLRKSFKLDTRKPHQLGAAIGAWRICGQCNVIYQSNGDSRCAGGPMNYSHVPKEGMGEFWLSFSTEDRGLQCMRESAFGICFDHPQRIS